jgi:hypothetical protein
MMGMRAFLLNLAPLAGRGRIAFAIRVRGYRSIDRSQSRREPLTPTLSPQARGEGAKLSSPGLTGRSSTPRLLDSIASFPTYWIPAFAGMTRCAWGDEKGIQTQC